MATSALPSTLRAVTATKIVELEKQRDHFEASRVEINKSLQSFNDQLDKTQTLLDGCCRIEGVRITDDTYSDDEIDHSRSPKFQKLNNNRRILRQARADPSFPTSIIPKIHDDLIKDLQFKSLQHQHAQFYSELVREWIEEAQDPADPADSTGSCSDGASDKSISSFETVGRKEMHEQRAQWESLVFSAPDVDSKSIITYLEGLFTSEKSVKKAHGDLKKGMTQFCNKLRNQELFNVDSVKICIKGLLAVDLLSEEKRAILKTFATNKEVLKEVADVLQMRFQSLSTWQWETVNSAIALEQRRQLNGNYRVYMDEDVLDALIVHIIGMEYSVSFKQQFTTFFNSFAWLRKGSTIPTEARERREWFLGSDAGSCANLPSRRREAYSTD
jgi:hypothetical protein